MVMLIPTLHGALLNGQKSKPRGQKREAVGYLFNLAPLRIILCITDRAVSSIEFLF